ncbi:unnamed protein product [Echinostoma caproni]|uniref:Neur_chan_LBD domain-containing protein n=1 Tax=Echinostoma caproni TaxID=27848 RepID=A0A183A5V4_9TREM|nr:unnamed protein product [Echinostoma caproni]
MAMNFNKLFLQDIIARRGSHVIDLGDNNERSGEEADYGSDYYNETSSDTLEELEGGARTVELFDAEPTGNSQKNRLLTAILELRAAVEKQNNLQSQLNGRLTPSPMPSYVDHEPTERDIRHTEKEPRLRKDSAPIISTVGATTSTANARNSKHTCSTTTATTTTTTTSQSSVSMIKTSEEAVKKPLAKLSEETSYQASDKTVDSNKLRTPSTETTHKKRLTSQSGSTDTADTDLASFKRCERLSKKKEKVIVEVRVVFLKIGEIDTLKEIYHADAFIQFKWREPRLDGKSEEDLRRIDLQRCWNPLVLIDNILSESKDQHWMLTQKSDQNEVYIVERRRLRGIFLETLELNDFPLDVQDLTITLTSERPDSEVVLVPDRSELCGINLQTLVDQQFFITGLSFATFAVPPERPENRLQLSFTLFLTSVAFKFVINQSLPKISYLTYMDKYVLMSLAILCVVSIWHAMVTLIPTDAVFEQEDVMNVLKFSSLDNATLFRLDNNRTNTTEVLREYLGLKTDAVDQPNNTAGRWVGNTGNNGVLPSYYLYTMRTPKIILTTSNPRPMELTTVPTPLSSRKSPLQSIKSNPFGVWDAEQWKRFAQQSTDMEQEKRMLKLRIERDVFASFCVLYGLAHLTFAFWLYFDVSDHTLERI